MRSTAARKDVQAMGPREPVAVATKTGSNAEAVGVVGSPRAASPESRFESGNQAGTQAPPVDAPKGMMTNEQAIDPWPIINAEIKRRGRPKLHPDRKAYKADHERKRRERV